MQRKIIASAFGRDRWGRKRLNEVRPSGGRKRRGRPSRPSGSDAGLIGTGFSSALADDDVDGGAPRAGLVVAATPDPEVVPPCSLEIGNEDADLLEVSQRLPRLLAGRRSFTELDLVETRSRI